MKIDISRFNYKGPAAVAADVLSTAPSPSMLAAHRNKAFTSKEATPSILVTLVIGSPDFQTEVAMVTRRVFLRSSAVAMAGVGVAPSWLVRAAAQSGRKRKVLVAIFQRGAADGLNVVVPFFEPRYYELRPTIAVAAPGKTNGAIDSMDGSGCIRLFSR